MLNYANNHMPVQKICRGSRAINMYQEIDIIHLDADHQLEVIIASGSNDEIQLFRIIDDKQLKDQIDINQKQMDTGRWIWSKLEPAMPNNIANLIMMGPSLKMNIQGVIKDEGKPDEKDKEFLEFIKLQKQSEILLNYELPTLKSQLKKMLSKEDAARFSKTKFFHQINNQNNGHICVVTENGWCLEYSLQIEDQLMAQKLAKGSSNTRLPRNQQKNVKILQNGGCIEG